MGHSCLKMYASPLIHMRNLCGRQPVSSIIFISETNLLGYQKVRANILSKDAELELSPLEVCGFSKSSV